MREAAIIVLPGSNCDRDIQHVLQNVYSHACTMVWHKEERLPPQTSLVVVPGGFSFGDYLRAGALASLSPVMQAVKDFAKQGGKILGICNGFQILCEMGLLPGTLLPNIHGRFVCEKVALYFSPPRVKEKIRLTLPIAHNEGRFFAQQAVLQKLIKDDMVALTYEEIDECGRSKINGSEHAIAGIYGGVQKNILGLMPHPERLAEKRLGGEDGKYIFEKFLFAQ